MDDATTNPLFQLAPVAYSILDADGVQIAANQKFSELFGYPPGIAITTGQLTHPEDRARTAAFVDQLIQNGHEVRSIEKRYVRADGSVFWGRLTASAIDTQGELRLLGVIEDIQTQHDLLEHLAGEVDGRTSLVAQVSHELRNPLHLICGTSELLAESCEGEQQRQQARSILAGARGLSRLVDDLVDLGSNAAGSLTLDHAPFMVRQLLDRVRVSVADQLNRHGIRLRIHVDEQCPRTVLGDSDRIHQVLLNLTTNAIKYAADGDIAIRVHGDTDDVVRFVVSDSGPGIPSEDIDRIFQPFVRLQGAKPGAGLGLAISHRLATLLDGSLTVRNCAPRGAAFELAVPLPEAKPGTSSAGVQPARTTNAVGFRVLIVEDNAENQMLAAAQIDALGHTSDIAPDGFSALDQLRDHHYDAVLMDWHLPGMDGLETTRRIRLAEAERQGRRLPIIAVTARTMAGDIEACFDAGVDDHIGKPATLHDIRVTLDRWLDQQRDDAEPTLAEADDFRIACEPCEPVVNDNILDALSHDLGGVEIPLGIIDTYLENLDERVGIILDGGDPVTVENAAHVLGSTSAMIGARAMEQLARSIEQHVRSGADVSPQECSSLRETAAATTAHLRAAAKAWRDR